MLYGLYRHRCSTCSCPEANPCGRGRSYGERLCAHPFKAYRPECHAQTLPFERGTFEGVSFPTFIRACDGFPKEWIAFNLLRAHILDVKTGQQFVIMDVACTTTSDTVAGTWEISVVPYEYVFPTLDLPSERIDNWGWCTLHCTTGRGVYKKHRFNLIMSSPRDLPERLRVCAKKDLQTDLADAATAAPIGVEITGEKRKLDEI